MECLPQIVRKEIDLLTQDDIVLTPEEIVWLYNLGKLVENPDMTTRAAAGVPVRCGPLVFWPSTIQADLWFDQHVTRLFKNPDMLMYCLAFAFCFGRDAELPDYCEARTFAELNTYDVIQKDVMAWAWQIPVTLAEIDSAVERMLETDEAPHEIKRPEPKEEPKEWDVLAECVAATGLSEEYWKRQTFQRAGAVLRASIRQSAIAFGSAPEKNEETGRAANALAEFGAAVDAIRKSRREKQNGA